MKRIRIRVFKKVAIIVGIAIGLYIGTSSAELITIPACEDVYIRTSDPYKTGDIPGYYPFLKFDISVVPTGKQIDSVFLRVIVFRVKIYWDGDVIFWNMNNQEWTESIYPDSLWDFPTSNSTFQDTGFGMEIGNTFSVDLKPIFLRDYDSSHTYCSIKMKDPDCSSRILSHSVNDSLVLGDLCNISFHSHEVSPDSAPTLFVYYGESSVEEEKFRPSSFALWQNNPNPCREFTTIKYQLPKSIHTTLRIYNVTGQLVKTLVNEEKESGTYAVTWDGKNNKGRTVTNGIYFYKLTAEDFTSAKKLFLMK